MLSSMYAAVMGLRNHQLRMDVIGNNIANLNTVGFKAGRVNFSEAFAQTLQSASPASGNRGGTNPFQVGMGSQVSSIDNLFNQGTLQSTGMGTDLALQGEGFFILGNGGNQSFTRDGAFNFDAQGNLVDPSSGLMVQGYMADNTGVVPPGSQLSGIKIPLDSTSAAKFTSQMVLHGNLDSSSALPAAGPPVVAGATFDATSSVFDSQGNKIAVTLTFTHSAANTWDVTLKAPTGGTNAITKTQLVFDNAGALKTAAGTSSFGKITLDPVGGAAGVSIDFADPKNAGAFTGMTQTAGESNPFVFSQDGYTAGSITRTTIDAKGNVVGTFSNGVTRNLAQIGLARFANENGLSKDSGNQWTESTNSGRAVFGTAGGTGFGTLQAGALESSNVDLASEFTDLIVAQRGFQANSKMITTGDEMLQEVVNIKR